jgi:hypothetical protein
MIQEAVMRSYRKAVSTLILTSLLCALPAVDAWALLEGRGSGGEPYATGGVGEDERERLLKRRQEFNVWITTAVKQSGAYLADVRINVVDAANRQVLSTALDGPLMLIQLAPGRYTIEATVDQQRQERTLAVGAQGHRELHFYFDVAAQALPREVEAKDDARDRKR